MIYVTVKAEIKTAFEDYGNKRKNEKAINSIKRWVNGSLNTECRFIPLYVDDGVEDVTQKSSIKLEVYDS